MSNRGEIVPLISDDVAFDQPCMFGQRVEGHAVYCTNKKWKDAPRKCRCSWYTDGKERDEDCSGFKPNPNYKKKT